MDPADPHYFSAAPLSDDALNSYFGATQPSRAIVESNMKFLQDVKRGWDWGMRSALQIRGVTGGGEGVSCRVTLFQQEDRGLQAEGFETLQISAGKWRLFSALKSTGSLPSAAVMDSPRRSMV